MFISEEEHDGTFIVQLIHLIEIVYVIGISVIAFIEYREFVTLFCYLYRRVVSKRM